MSIETVAAAMGGLAVLGQVVNVLLNLRIRNSQLELEGSQREWVRLQLSGYVQLSRCELLHQVD